MGILDRWPLTIVQDGSTTSSRAKIRCVKCGEEESISGNIRHNEQYNFIKTHFTKNGWYNARDGVGVCPKCSNIAKSVKGEQKMAKSPVVSLVVPKAVEPSPASGQAKALLGLAICDNYDAVNKRYKNGYSDERISKEVGLSLEFVKKRREEDFGPLVQHVDYPKVIQEICSAAAAVRDDLRKVNDSKFTEVGIAMAALVSSVTRLEKIAVAARNGG